MWEGCGGEFSVVQGGTAQERGGLARNVTIFLASRSWCFVWHSQTTNTSHPSFLRDRFTLASRALFLSNFLSQNARRVDGMDRPLRQLCRCQKQPWTKTTFIRPEKTRSGEPGRCLECSLNRYPRRCASLRTISSGAVSRLVIARMISDRLRLSKTSVTNHITMSGHSDGKIEG